MAIRAFLLAFLFCAIAVLVQAQSKSDSDSAPGVRGEIVGPGRTRFPIAVAALKNLGTAPDTAKLSEGLADAIVHDLELSGWFRIIDRAAHIEQPQKSGITLGAFDFKDWSTIGA